MEMQRRFLAGLAAQAGFDPGALDSPGTLVRAREERAGTGVVVCYWAGRKALVWGDPALIDKLEDLADADRTVDLDTATAHIGDLGSKPVASADMRIIETGAPAGGELGAALEVDGGAIVPGPVPAGYRQRWLDTNNPRHVELVRAFADRCDPDDVEEAALDDMDNYDETAINVLVPTGPEHHDEFVAYASAAAWDWDPDFADIGVLIDARHRGRGLGTLVVAHTVAALGAAGLAPLYRHGHHNAGSQRIAETLGFTTATTLHFFSPPD